jgi:DNA-binding NarL/FixJ family response regulator
MIAVAIVEDVKDIREGLRLLIDNSDDFMCREVYASAEEALAGLPQSQPEVVLMDINLPGINGIECIRQLKPQCAGTQFIMSTVYEDDESIFESLKAGATGYLLKKTEPAKILEAIREVYSGGSPMSTQIARKVIASFQFKSGIDEADILTHREKEILKALSKGLRYKEIASEMHISIETVRTHVRRIYEKLQVQSRTEALNKVYGRS